ncbi:hypothetical protein DAEQUDRAFT_391082 [Daedalea quercina L-15889]|uniref:Uncharacterized protein n=1 Tax=Daedalea quercina L-15889 TaxID=1314783 RepID=A0A165NV68_9APHY|nr:hypothetical protein DAEQUDRAFT_391082 [Daedalea quercina L-15889]
MVPFLNGIAASAGIDVKIDHNTDRAIQRVIEELELKDQLRGAFLALRVALATLSKQCNDSLETIKDEVRDILWWLRMLIMVWVAWYALQILVWLRTILLVVVLLGIGVLSLKSRVRCTGSSDESKQENTQPDSQKEDEGAEPDSGKKTEGAERDDGEDEVDAEDFASFLAESGLGELLTLRLRRLVLLKHLVRRPNHHGA